MPRTVTITDLTFTEARLYSTVDDAGVTHIFVSVGYIYTTSDGSRLTGERNFELTGIRRTQVAQFFTNLKADLLTLEGI